MTHFRYLQGSKKGPLFGPLFGSRPARCGPNPFADNHASTSTAFLPPNLPLYLQSHLITQLMQRPARGSASRHPLESVGIRWSSFFCCWVCCLLLLEGNKRQHKATTGNKTEPLSREKRERYAQVRRRFGTPLALY